MVHQSSKFKNFPIKLFGKTVSFTVHLKTAKKQPSVFEVYECIESSIDFGLGIPTLYCNKRKAKKAAKLFLINFFKNKEIV